MRTRFNLQGSNRKPLVKAIEELTGRKGNYTMSGDMRYAFDFGDGLTLHRDGTLTDEGNIFGLLTGLAERGFTGEASEAEAKHRDEEAAAGGDRTDREERDGFGNWDGDATPAYLRDIPEPQGGGIMEADNAEGDRLTVEFPFDGFTPEALDNLNKMVIAKEPLIKAALGADELPIQVAEDTVRFPWFTLSGTGDAAYYVQFVFALCQTAKAKKRVTAKAADDIANPKFAFRVFLLSLGMVGDEYKAARKLLLKNLTGNSSFASAESKERWDAKHSNKEAASDE